MPRSPTMTMSDNPKRSLTLVTAATNALGSPVLPANTSTATGRPSPSVINPYSIWDFPALRSLEYPRAASGQCVPSTHDEDRSNITVPPAARCRFASAFSIDAWRATSQSIASYTSSVVASPTPKSTPSVVSAHHRVVDSFEPGRASRATIEPMPGPAGDMPGPTARAGPTPSPGPRLPPHARVAATARSSPPHRLRPAPCRPAMPGSPRSLLPVTPRGSPTSRS